LIGANVLLYEDNNFDRYVHKISVAKVAKFSIAPDNAPYHILCYMPGKCSFLYDMKIYAIYCICSIDKIMKNYKILIQDTEIWV